MKNGRLIYLPEPIAKVKTEDDERNYEIQTGRKAAGIPSAECRGFWGEV